MLPADALTVAARLFAAIEAGDLETIHELYAPQVVIWHAHDGGSQGREENLRTLALARAAIDGLRYEEVRRHATERGFVQQHVLRGTARLTGLPLELPAAIVCTVEEGRIVRLDEYFDRAPLRVLTPASDRAT